MTNYPDGSKFEDLIEDTDPAGAKLVADLEALYVAPLPEMRFTLPTEPSAGGRLRWWQPALAGAVAAVGLAAVLIAPSLWHTESPVSAEAIFARASTAADTSAPAAGTTSYHLVATTMTPGQPADFRQPATYAKSETWYADASHIRTEQDYDSTYSGADFGLLVSGDEAWLYGAFDGVYRAARGPASELGAGFGGVVPGAAADIGEVLGQYGDGCQVAHAEGEDVIAGRPAHKIVVSVDVDACPAFYAPKEPEKLGALTVWVDKESFLPLKTEQLDATGAPMYVYEVTQIEVGGVIPDSVFAYQAPSGTTVQDVADMTEAKFVLSGYTPDGVPAR